jgi:hypothetical protein
MASALAIVGTLLGASGANADFILVGNLGDNPSAPIGREVGINPFQDAYTFNLTNATFFNVAANANNSFANPNNFLANFSISIYSLGANGVFNGGTGDDILVLGPANGINPCNGSSTNQCAALSGILAAGSYFVGVTGDAVGTGTGPNTGQNARYDGNVDTFAAVPGPVVGAGLPGLLMACAGLIALARRRRRRLV